MKQFETLIPFGKYKGHPLSVMLNDESYLRWYFDENIASSYPVFIQL